MVFEQVTDKINVGGFLSSGANAITILVLIGVALGILAAILYFVFSNLKFNQKIVIFENLGGVGFRPTGTDKATIVKFGDGGEVILFLKKRKVYRSAYGEKMGAKLYWFAVGRDGYWRNFTLGNIDKKLKEMGVKFTDRDMRHMHVAIRRNIKDRFERTSFWQKYGGLIAYITLIAITGIMMWLLFDKFLEISSSNKAAIEAAREVLEAAKGVLGATANVKSGSGIA